MSLPDLRSAPAVAEDIAARLTSGGIARVESPRARPYDGAQQARAWPVVRVYPDRQESTPASSRGLYDEQHTVKLEIVAQGQTIDLAVDAVAAADAACRAILLTDAEWLGAWSVPPRITAQWSYGVPEQGPAIPAALCSWDVVVRVRATEYVTPEGVLVDLLEIVNNTRLPRDDGDLPADPDVGFTLDASA